MRARARQVRTLILCVLVASLIAASVLFYVQWRDTDDLMQYVESVFEGQIPFEETSDSPLRRYNWTNDGDIPNHGSDVIVELDLRRMFVLHNYFDGRIWVTYSVKIYTRDGFVYESSSNVSSTWIIHKTKDGWEIVRIIERT